MRTMGKRETVTAASTYVMYPGVITTSVTNSQTRPSAEKAASTKKTFTRVMLLSYADAASEIADTTSKLNEAEPIKLNGPISAAIPVLNPLCVAALMKLRKVSGSAAQNAISVRLMMEALHLGTPTIIVFPSKSLTSMSEVLFTILETASRRYSVPTEMPTNI